jgi:soluble lytic murein transglycosylase-like protein
MTPTLRISLFLAIALGLGALVGARPARAELVVLTDGRYLKVTAYEADDQTARLSLAFGGRVTLPIERVERVIDDEVVPEPEPEEVIAAEAPPINLRFEEGQPVPEGPYGALIYETARRHGVNPTVVAALIRQESAGKVRARSNKGARGLMQLMPATAIRFGVRKELLYTPEHNLEAGVRYLSWLLDQFPGDLAKVLAAYNAGENAVVRYQGVPPYRETREYVRRIFTTLGLTIADLTRPVSSGPAGSAVAAKRR